MHCSKLLYLLAACCLYTSFALGLGRSRSQFKTFFPTIEEHDKWRFEANCSDQFIAHWNGSQEDPGRGHEWSKTLLECILEGHGEVNKANMAATGIMLALLPAGLVQFGPRLAEISLLSTRRPILATLLGFGLLPPTPTEFDFEKILSRALNGGQDPELEEIQTTGRPRALPRLLGPAVRLVAGLHIITGTVLIGSIILIPLADSLPVIYAFISAAICTRAILSFELNGLALKTNPETAKLNKKKTASTDQSDTWYEAGGLKSQEYTNPSQVDSSMKTASGRLG
ncbi:hypothetical protein FCOIX_8306 [Fusarium coicis]|nr:hypothetical protein FCOIX_8306 [Fusarium coicis]